MESSSFYKRFKNKTQFVGKEGLLALGVFYVNKKPVSKRKLHAYSPSVPNIVQSPNNSFLSGDSFQNVNRSYGQIRLPKLDCKKPSLHNPKKYLNNSISSSSLGYSLKKRILLNQQSSENRLKVHQRNNSIV